VTRVWIGQSRVGIQAGTGDLCLLKNVQSSFGGPFSLFFSRYWAFFPDHPPSSNAGVKNEWSYVFSPLLYIFMA